MTETPPWEPPMAGSDVEHLLGSIERMRATFRWKAGGLDTAGLATRVGASELTLGRLLKHLAIVEDHLSTTRLDGSSIGLPWTEIHDGTPDFEFRTADTDSPEDLYGFYDGAVARSRERHATAIAAGGLDQPVALSDDEGNHPSLRRLLHDLLEEYGRHVGHADLLREAVDGLVGEDPPWDFRLA
jgi:hypothetical protein